MSTPNIRFKGFSNAWEQRKLGDMGQFKNGMNFSKDAMDKGYPFVNLQNIFGKNIIETENLGLAEASDTQLKEYNLKQGDVLFVRSSVKLEGVGEAALVPKDLENTTYSGFVIRFRDESDMDSNFKRFIFGTKPIRNQIMAKATNSANKNISQDVLNNLELYVPTKEEQEKIGEYFSNLDNLITLHQRKCDETKILKKYMLKKMFPKNGEDRPEIRFEGFSDAWEQCKLGDMVSFSKGSGYSKGDLKEDGTPIILYGRLYTKYETVISEVDTFVDEKKGSVFSKGGEVIVPASGETAEDISIASVVEKSGVLLGGDLNVITPPDDMDSAFLAISISNGKPHNDMAKMAQGKSVVHLHNSDLEKIDLLYPCFEEQQRISGFFSNLDNLITLHQRKCGELKEMKQFMLQNMFPH